MLLLKGWFNAIYVLTICVALGLYDEQFEISSKIPFELLGHGPPGSVILIISVEQNAATGRLCNLFLKPPWFTQYVIKVSWYQYVFLIFNLMLESTYI